jgi:hypothetical protein
VAELRLEPDVPAYFVVKANEVTIYSI